MKIKFLFFSSILLIASFSDASILTLSKSFKVQFESDLRNELEARIRTLNRSVSVYHYGSRGPLRYSNYDQQGQPQNPISLSMHEDEAINLKRGYSDTFSDYSAPVELHPSEAETYFKSMSNLMSTRPNKWSVGGGLYAAVDPIQSSIYGGIPWFLLKIDIPASIRYLDIRPFDGFVFSSEFVHHWFKDELLSGEWKMFRVGKNSYYIEMSKLLNNPQLKQIFIQAFQELKIDFITYFWSKHTIQRCLELSEGQKIGFNFVNSSFLTRIPKNSLSIFTENLEVLPVSEKFQAYQKIRELSNASKLSFSFNASSSSEIPNYYNGINLMNSYKGLINQLAWEKTLGRSTSLALFFTSSSLDILKSFFNFETPPKDSNLFNESQNLSYVSNLNWFINPFYSNSFKVEFDPLEYLKNVNFNSYYKNLNLIENSVFGCSPEHPEENITPEIH